MLMILQIIFRQSPFLKACLQLEREVHRWDPSVHYGFLGPSRDVCTGVQAPAGPRSAPAFPLAEKMMRSLRTKPASWLLGDPSEQVVKSVAELMRSACLAPSRSFEVPSRHRDNFSRQCPADRLLAD